jgi:hypothetical protein
MRTVEQHEHATRRARGGGLAVAAALVLAAFAGTPAVASAGTPAGGGVPAGATINCVGCVYHSSYYDAAVWQRAWHWCDDAGWSGQQKGYWREYACTSTHNGYGADLKVRWNA